MRALPLECSTQLSTICKVKINDAGRALAEPTQRARDTPSNAIRLPTFRIALAATLYCRHRWLLSRLHDDDDDTRNVLTCDSIDASVWSLPSVFVSVVFGFEENLRRRTAIGGKATPSRTFFDACS